MIEQYELYCLADRLFYDTVDNHDEGGRDFTVTGRPVPEGWQHEPTDTWMHYGPVGAAIPRQGWKIHVSACLEDAERVLTTVWDYCVPRGITFKFLRSQAIVVMLNSKAAGRGSSGKLVTIYPQDDGQLELILKELNETLSGVKGPYILSDLRYEKGPLYVRYGGFMPQFCLADNGERVAAIANADGKMVPDVRGPVFAIPSWVTLPEFLEPHLAERNSVTFTDLPYEIDSVMQFSNGGGVYLGRDRRTGQRVVLKEGRPYAGLDVSGRDAVARIAHERDILQRLSGLDVVPAFIDYFTVGEHHFLVQEFIDGNPLTRLMVRRFPLSHPDITPQILAEYTEWVLDKLAAVQRAVDALHERGVVFGDLHPSNILVTDEGRMVLIDFEVATLVQDNARSALAHPAYCAPRDRRGVDVDRYALACMHIGMFAPQTTILLNMQPRKILHLAELVTELFPVPREAMDRAVSTILGAENRQADEPDPMADLPMPGIAAWSAVRDALRTAILASATPDRDDRLFPGDIKQFSSGGGLNLAHGAAGVLYALAATGAGRYPEHEDWLRKRALTPHEGANIGFYDGLHGIAYALDTLGHRQDALDIVDLCLDQRWELHELSLHGGLAGMGLNLLHFARTTGETTLSDLALRIVDIVADRLGGPDDVPQISGGPNAHAGLMLGSSGPALLFLHAYEQTGDPALLDSAAVALRQDLRRCIQTEDGTMQVNQGWRTLPYLDEGSVGIGMVLERYLAHRHDETFTAALDAMLPVTRSGFFVQNGLFAGRCSMIAWRGMRSRHMTATHGNLADPETTELIRWLGWHALPYGGGLAFPGDQLMRLSMDLATGTAGTLLALGTVLHDRPVFLPFFERHDPTST